LGIWFRFWVYGFAFVEESRKTNTYPAQVREMPSSVQVTVNSKYMSTSLLSLGYAHIMATHHYRDMLLGTFFGVSDWF